MLNAYLPHAAYIRERTQDTKDIFTLYLEFVDPSIQQNFQFEPGQFNMLYLLGVGEVAISIASDPQNKKSYQHTIRAVGQVTQAMMNLQVGDQLGVRGPYGSGWPMQQAQGKDVMIVTGGLGCAPTVSVIHYIMQRREQFGRLIILQGVKHSDDLIFRKQYQQWERESDVEVHLAADAAGKNWPWHTGVITDLINQANIDPQNTICMMCGPEGMMGAAIKVLQTKQLPESAIYLSMERNMKCAIGLCGHCMYGGQFICKDGPVFCYPKIKPLFGKKGF